METITIELLDPTPPVNEARPIEFSFTASKVTITFDHSNQCITVVNKEGERIASGALEQIKRFIIE